MPNNKLAKLLSDKLPSGHSTLFNPYSDRSDEDEPCNGPDAKLARLAAHLDCVPKFILCGEAAGYQGCRYSGIAFTSEYLLREGKIPRIPAMSHRLTTRRLPYREPSATIVWKALYELGIKDRTILWNALPVHPHKPGNKQSNRTPKSHEIKIGEPALQRLVAEFPKAKVIAVGRKAERSLRSLGIVPAATVRHPANGGAKIFTQQLQQFVNG
jgi:uracil-DNA glycosylase